jgi:PAS domain S-box-containing protein
MVRPDARTLNSAISLAVRVQARREDMSENDIRRSVITEANELDLAHAEQERVADDLTRLIDTANAPIIGIDARGRVNEWNQTAVRMTGFSKAEAVGKDLVETFITNDFKESVREVLEKALLGEETSNYEFPLFSKSGERIHLLLNATSRRAKDQRILGVIGIGQDITGRLEREENLRHRERIEAVGSLTGGIAHDFNNLLTVVTGNLSMLAPRAGEEQEIIDDAMKAARDGSELVRNLLAFSRRQSLEPETCSMDTVLNHFQRSLGRALGEAVKLEVSIEETGLAAFIDKARFEAALLNVCINARDAVTTNGRITLKVFSSSPNHGDAPLARNAQGSNDDSVCVQISDNGSGIEPELLSKITDPYFTTKDIGEGSGLGLSSVVGFVDQSGGSFRIFSTLGVGTTVEIFLPLSSQVLTAERSRISTHAVDFATGQEQTTIMVVDDEPNVLRLASRWLRRAGYNVIEAKNGDEALASIDLRNGDIDVLFSDIVMPGELNGWALAEEVSARYPRIGIQLATGYDQVSQGEKSRVTKKRFPVLSKPYNLTDLSNSVRRLVSEKSRRPRPSAVAATNTTPGP